MRQILLIIFLFALYVPGRSTAQTFSRQANDTSWADSVLHSLSLDEKIAQLMIIRAWSYKDSTYNDSMCGLIKNWNAGGVCFFKGTPSRQAKLTNYWQENAKTPLLIAIDAETGLGMRLDSAFSFPRQMTLGATRDDSLLYRMGARVAADCRRLGIQINFAPVVDINNNPLNPVINMRSFGEDRDLVARKGIMYMKGLQDNGIMATAKHFPGHGDTDADSHFSLPIIQHSGTRLDSIELYPFRELISNGLEGVMVAHLYVPALDSSKNTPTTLSYNVISGLLKHRLGFQGFVITDALDMKGVTRFYKPGEIEIKALLAGNDILLLPQDLPVAVKAIRQAVDNNQLPAWLIEQKCRRILQLKYESGLAHPGRINTNNLYADLNSRGSELLSREMIREAVTVEADDNNMLPLRNLGQKKIACLSLGDTAITSFQKMISNYAPVRFVNLPKEFPSSCMDSVINELKKYDLVIAGIHKTSSFPEKKYGITSREIELIDTLGLECQVILSFFGNPYALNYFGNAGKLKAVIISYQDTKEAEEFTAQAIFGGIPATGKLPVTVSKGMKFGEGKQTQKSRLAYVFPEEAGVPSAELKIIDSLAMNGITSGAYPGCQVLFASHGKVFYQKSFGHPTYYDSIPVTNDDLYDLASVTKLAATTLAMMKLVEDGKIKLDDKLSQYLPELKRSNKKNILIRDVMAHQAGLQAWIPYYKKTLMDRYADSSVYRSVQSDEFPYRVAENMYINKKYQAIIYKEIIRSPVNKKKEYLYSDLGFYLLRRLVEKVSGKSLPEFVRENFYQPLGLSTMCFSPREQFPLSRIIPTENDLEFRKQLLRGDVHDQGAAMLGGVSGHAGLFSDANDLAIILQMLIQDGTYGGTRYFLPSTVAEFTKVQFPENGNRRGLGFDKPLLGGPSSNGPVCQGAPSQSFGHSGFTGTYIWADPVNELVYVFLSNRVNPYAWNQKLLEMNIRTKIHQAMYDILNKKYNYIIK